MLCAGAVLFNALTRQPVLLQLLLRVAMAADLLQLLLRNILVFAAAAKSHASEAHTSCPSAHQLHWQSAVS